jgi:hypothetical protein
MVGRRADADRTAHRLYATVNYLKLTAETFPLFFIRAVVNTHPGVQISPNRGRGTMTYGPNGTDAGSTQPARGPSPETGTLGEGPDSRPTPRRISGQPYSSMRAIDELKVRRAPGGQWMVALPDATLPISEFIDAISNRTFSLEEAGPGNLNEAERAAMFRFVNGADYRTYNTLLMDPDQLSKRKLRNTLKRVVAMQSGLNKLPDYQGVVYRVAVGRGSTAANYNGIGAGEFRVGATTTTKTFVGACQFAFIMVEHSPVVYWTAIRSRHASVQPASVEEVTFPLGTPIEISGIQKLDPRKIVAHIDQDAEVRWVQIGANRRPFIGVRLTYGDQMLPDFYFLSAPTQFRLLPTAAFTSLFDGPGYRSHSQREIDRFKKIPLEKRFQELWASRLDSLGRPGQLPEIIYLVEAEEKPKSVAPIATVPDTDTVSVSTAGFRL